MFPSIKYNSKNSTIDSFIRIAHRKNISSYSRHIPKIDMLFIKFVSNPTKSIQVIFSLSTRGVRYIDEKLSKADKSVFLKLSATYRYQKMNILKLSKNYQYRKMHQIWSDKYMKSPKYQTTNFN